MVRGIGWRGGQRCGGVGCCSMTWLLSCVVDWLLLGLVNMDVSGKCYCKDESEEVSWSDGLPFISFESKDDASALCQLVDARPHDRRSSSPMVQSGTTWTLLESDGRWREDGLLSVSRRQKVLERSSTRHLPV